MKNISAKEARDHLSEVINQVSYGGEKFTLTRHGNGVAVIISLKEWETIEQILQKLENEEDIRDADAAYTEYLKEGGVPYTQVKKKLGLD